jgi:hypothetical protein
MAEQQSSTWIPVGAHAFREEPEDELVVLRFQGDIVPEEGPLMAASMRGFLRDGRTRLFLMLDMAAMGDVPSSARKSIAEAMLDVPIAATAVFGASFTQRVIGTLTDRTNNLLRGGRRYETRFFSTEEQARGWLARKRLEQAKPPGGA